MAAKHLGDVIDIHGGGADLKFPHHENEIAQSRCAAPDAGFARVWMHNGMINVDGRKMSKSFGNFLTVKDLRNQASEEVLRLALLGTHYRGTLDWTEQRQAEAVSAISKWGKLTDGVQPATEVPQGVLDALCDDLNTPAAIAHLHGLANAGDAPGLAAGMKLLNFSIPARLAQRISGHAVANAYASGTLRRKVDGDLIEDLLARRSDARAAKDFATADAIRKALDEAGVVIIDQKDSPSEWRLGPNFDAAKLEGLK